MNGAQHRRPVELGQVLLDITAHDTSMHFAAACVRNASDSLITVEAVIFLRKHHISYHHYYSTLRLGWLPNMATSYTLAKQAPAQIKTEKKDDAPTTVWNIKEFRDALR